MIDTATVGLAVPAEAIEDADVMRVTSGSLLVRNTPWNLVGQVALIGVALFAIPVPIRYIGMDRFGIIFMRLPIKEPPIETRFMRPDLREPEQVCYRRGRHHEL